MIFNLRRWGGHTVVLYLTSDVPQMKSALNYVNFVGQCCVCRTAAEIESAFIKVEEGEGGAPSAR